MIFSFLIGFTLFLSEVATPPDSISVNPNFTISCEKDTLIESLNDSIDLATNFWSIPFEDEDFDSFDSYEEYESFDSDKIHYPKVDFSNKKDTTVIPLIWGDMVYAHPSPGRLTSGFGIRRWRPHYGVDLKLRTGDPVAAAFDGVVRVARRSPSYGYLVVIRHINGLETYYAHLSKLKVKPEDQVKAGDIIGLGGNTGRSYGSHLHFEIRYLGAPLNPQYLIDFEKQELISPVLYLSPHHFKYLEDVKKLSQAVFHTVRSGDTLGAIARRYGTSVSAICRLNGIRSNSIIRPNQRLRVR